MNRAALSMDQLLHSLPVCEEGLRPYLDKAKAFSNECGCSTGATFLVASLGLVVVDCFLPNGFRSANLFVNTLGGVSFVFTSSMVGKLTGILIARARLKLLYRHLIAKFQIEGD